MCNTHTHIAFKSTFWSIYFVTNSILLRIYVFLAYIIRAQNCGCVIFLTDMMSAHVWTQNPTYKNVPSLGICAISYIFQGYYMCIIQISCETWRGSFALLRCFSFSQCVATCWCKKGGWQGFYQQKGTIDCRCCCSWYTRHRTPGLHFSNPGNCISQISQIVFLKCSKFGIFKPILNGGSNTGAVLTLHTLSDTTHPSCSPLSRKHLILGMFQKHGRLYQLLTCMSPLLAQEMVWYRLTPIGHFSKALYIRKFGKKYTLDKYTLKNTFW